VTGIHAVLDREAEFLTVGVELQIETGGGWSQIPELIERPVPSGQWSNHGALCQIDSRSELKRCVATSLLFGSFVRPVQARLRVARGNTGNQQGNEDDGSFHVATPLVVWTSSRAFRFWPSIVVRFAAAEGRVM
jgi:hypothetical protein